MISYNVIYVLEIFNLLSWFLSYLIEKIKQIFDFTLFFKLTLRLFLIYCYFLILNYPRFWAYITAPIELA